MGGLAEFFRNFPRLIGLAFSTIPVILTLVGIAGIITFVALSKSQKVQQRAFVRKVKNVKTKQKEYKNEKDQNKIESRVKKYNKSLNKLRSRIKYALWWNPKKIVLSDPYLIEETEESNLSISGSKFTFKDVLTDMVNKKSKNKKKNIQIIERNKTIKQLSGKTTQKEIKPVVTKLNEPQKKIEAIKMEDLNQKGNLKSIYKTDLDDEKLVK